LTRPRSVARLMSIAALFGASLTAGAAGPPTVGEMAHCAAIAVPDTRLACYDALAGRPPERSALGAAAAAPNAPAAANAPAAPTAPVARAAPSAPSAPSAPAAPASAANDVANFGFTQGQVQVHTGPVGPTSIQARISKVTADQLGRTYLILDNGQMWTSTDAEVRDDVHMGPGDSVTIKKGALGSFLMVTASRRTYHVRRSQ
jgi:hypothetical protein